MSERDVKCRRSFPGGSDGEGHLGANILLSLHPIFQTFSTEQIKIVYQTGTVRDTFICRKKLNCSPDEERVF